jgi:chromosome segregation ATPase
VDRHQGKSGYCKEQIGETDARAEVARREAADLEARVGPLRESLETRRADEGRLRAEVETSQAEAREAETAVQESASHQARTEGEQEAARDAQVGLMSRMATLQNARASVSGSADRAGADLMKLAGERGELDRERVRVHGLREAAGAKSAAVEGRPLELTGQRDDAAMRAAAGHERVQGLAREAEGLQRERDGLLGRLSSLEEMVATHSAFDEGVRAILADPSGVEVLGVVADALETDSAHERAVEAFLGDRLQAVLTPDAAHALRGIRQLQESGAGRGTFLPLASARTRSDCGPLRDIAREEPKVQGLLSDLYRVTGPHADRIRASLPDALVVASLEDAFEVIGRHGPVACATLAGETVRGAMVEGGRGVKGLLAPRREIRELGVRRESIEAGLAEARGREAEERYAPPNLIST